MVTMSEVLSQLKQLGIRPGFWAKAEVHELPRILMPEERLNQVSMGWYNGGFALLCCTDKRVLLIDKKIFFLTLEDCRYDMIAEVMYQHRLLDATLTLTFASKTLQFKSWNQATLRRLASYIQQRVMEVRRRYDEQQQVTTPYILTAINSGQVNQPHFAKPEQKISNYVMPQIQGDPTPSINPYQGRPYFRRRISRFVTTSQLSR